MTTATMPDLRGLSNRALITDVEVRDINEDKRQATFVAATEGGVDTWMGPEVLRMSGLDLARYAKNAVVLDSHDRSSASKIIGRASAKVQKRQLVTTITFAETALAEEIWTLVRTDFARALSVGFMIREYRELAEGEHDGRGDARVDGPAVIVTAWELYEISVVPVGADQDAVRSRFLASSDAELAAYVRRAWGAPVPEKEIAMSEKDKEQGGQPKTETPPAPEVKRETPAPVTPTAAELTARDAVALSAAIRAITPKGLEAVADAAILDGKTLDEARAMLKAEAAKRQAPAGTPDAPPPPEKITGERDSAAPEKLADVDDDLFVRSLAHL